MKGRERAESASVPKDMADGILVRQSLAGDQSAFELLVHRYHRPLFSFISRYLGDDDLAWDVLQHVWLQFYRSLSKLCTDEPIRHWLFRVARNRCLDELRCKCRKRSLCFSEMESSSEESELSPLALLPDTNPLPEEVAELHELQHRLRQAIEKLPPKLRVIVLLRSVGQLSFSQIGKTLQMPEATAKTYFYRARPLLRAALASMHQSMPASS